MFPQQPNNNATVRDLAELIFVKNARDGKVVCFQAPGIGSAKDLFWFLLHLFEHGLSLIRASSDTGMVLLNDITMDDVGHLRTCLAHAGIHLIVTKHSGRIVSDLHYVTALVNKSATGGRGPNVEDYAYLVDLPGNEHVNISFSLTYPTNNHVSSSACGMSPFMRMED